MVIKTCSPGFVLLAHMDNIAKNATNIVDFIDILHDL